MRGRAGHEAELLAQARELIAQVERAGGLQLRPALHEDLGAQQRPDEALQVGGLGDVHGGAGGGQGVLRGTGPVDAGGEELLEHVVLIGGQNEAADRHPHGPGQEAGVDIAEVARGHAHVDAVAGAAPLLHGVGDPQPGPHVVDGLRGDPADVDGVDGAQVMSGLELRVVAQRLDQRLAVVEDTAHRDVVDVGVLEGVHLGALHRAHAAGRREHEDADTLLPPEGVLGRRTGVTGGGAQDVEHLSVLGQHIGNRLPQELHGQVLEGHRRSLGQAHEGQAVGDLVKPGDRDDRLWEPLRAIGGLGQLGQVLPGNVGGEQADDFRGQVGVVQGPPGLDLLGAQGWQLAGNRQATVGRQARHKNVREPRCRHLATGGDVLGVLHVPPSCRVA